MARRKIGAIKEVIGKDGEAIAISDYENLDGIIDIAKKRTQWIAINCADYHEMSLRDALANAYLQAMEDAVIAEQNKKPRIRVSAA